MDERFFCNTGLLCPTLSRSVPFCVVLHIFVRLILAQCSPFETIAAYFTVRNEGPEKLGNLSKVTQLRSGGAGICAGTVWVLRSSTGCWLRMQILEQESGFKLHLGHLLAMLTLLKLAGPFRLSVPSFKLGRATVTHSVLVKGSGS